MVRRPGLKLLGSLFLAVAAALAFTPPAVAYPLLHVTACDTLSTDPLRVRTTFDLSSFAGAGYSGFVIHPMPFSYDPTPEDSLHFYDCGAPPGWRCDRYPNYAPLFFELTEIWTGELVSGFTIVSNRAAPCVLMIFGTVVIGEEYSIEACLRCDAPVPARHASWGEVKSIYR